jgi:hypothetical protein
LCSRITGGQGSEKEQTDHLLIEAHRLTGMSFADMVILRPPILSVNENPRHAALPFDLNDDETAALLKELNHIIDGDRYFLSPRIQTLKAILAKRRPEPVGEPLPPLKHYEPPRATTARRRRSGR